MTRLACSLLMLGSLGALAVPARAATTLAGPPRYVVSAGALVVPYRGDYPVVTAEMHGQPPRITMVLRDAGTPWGAVSETLSGDPRVIGWSMAPDGAGGLRFTLRLRQLAQPRVWVDTVTHRLFLIPLAPGVDGRGPAWASGWQEIPLGPGVDVPPTPEPPPVAVLPLPPVASPMGHLPLPVRTPRPYPLVGFPSPVPSGRTASPSPAPSAPVPVASPTPPPARPQADDWPVSVGAALMPASYQETYASGGVDARTEGLPIQELEVAGQTPDGWGGRLRLSTVTYAFQDQFLPLSVHTRQEWRGELGAFRRLAFGPLTVDLGAGYLLRNETGTHTGAPPSPSYAFTPTRLVHGPELAIGLGCRLGFGVGVFAEGGYAPYLFSSLPAELPALPMLSRSRLEGGVSAVFGPLRVTAGYRRWQTSGSGYDEVFSGPVVSLGLGRD